MTLRIFCRTGRMELPSSEMGKTGWNSIIRGKKWEWVDPSFTQFFPTCPSKSGAYVSAYRLHLAGVPQDPPGESGISRFPHTRGHVINTLKNRSKMNL